MDDVTIWTEYVDCLMRQHDDEISDCEAFHLMSEGEFVDECIVPETRYN